MSFVDIRRLLFRFHMWIGLVLGLLLALLGLSGSILVYDDAIGDFLAPVPKATAKGEALPLDKIVEAARGAAGRGAMQISLPREPGEAISVRVTQSREGAQRSEGRARRNANGASPLQAAEGPRAAATQVFIDPVSGAVLGSRKAQLPPLLMFAHQLHGNFLMGREGRTFVGWLGVAMLILGATGLVLWWPKRGQWKYAFFVRRTATGLRFHRELHAATGIWIFVVFMAVSFSGVVLAFPNLQTGGAHPTFNLREGPEIAPGTGMRLGPDAALALAKKALPDATPTGITIPSRPDRTIVVSMLAHDAVGAQVYVDPWQGRVAGKRDPSESFLAWQRPVHQGVGLGAVWRGLVFLSGFVPSLFVVTGVIMWAKKRKRRLPMATLVEEVAG
ncbi:MAG TPA: PepSY-associated TM helix domain-containing protein [Rhizomicrobium sp.]|jgi:uncharacterized iron-regulated membrane protein